MTIDVEDYFHVSVFDGVVPRAAWDSHGEPRRAPTPSGCSTSSTSTRVRGTFFVLGWVAERYPALVRAIAARGHELASHGYAHRLVYDQTPDAFREDVRRAKALHRGRRRAAGSTATARRASRSPPRSLWALDVLIEEGYRYDASIFPIRHDRYGIPDAPRWPHAMRAPAGALVRGAGVDRRASAAPTCRSPAAATSASCRTPGRAGASRRVNRSSGQPAIFYLHPVGDRPGAAAAAAPARWAGSATTAISTRPKRACARCCATSASGRSKRSSPAARHDRRAAPRRRGRHRRPRSPFAATCAAADLDRYVARPPARDRLPPRRGWLGVIERAFGHETQCLAAESARRRRRRAAAGVLPEPAVRPLRGVDAVLELRRRAGRRAGGPARAAWNAPSRRRARAGGVAPRAAPHASSSVPSWRRSATRWRCCCRSRADRRAPVGARSIARSATRFARARRASCRSRTAAPSWWTSSTPSSRGTCATSARRSTARRSSRRCCATFPDTVARLRRPSRGPAGGRVARATGTAR